MGAILNKENIYPEIKIGSVKGTQDRLVKENIFTDRYRLILVEEGTCIIRHHGKRYLLTAPAMYCLNEDEGPDVEESTDIRVRGLYFYPSLVNSAFDFKDA